jgi:hypothetical protein
MPKSNSEQPCGVRCLSLRAHDDYAPAGSVVLLYSAGVGTKAETALDRLDVVPFLASSTASLFTKLSCAKPLTVHYHFGRSETYLVL